MEQTAGIGGALTTTRRSGRPLGALGLIALAVPVPLATAVYVLLAGPLMHGAFSVLAFRLGGKTRPA